MSWKGTMKRIKKRNWKVCSSLSLFLSPPLSLSLSLSLISHSSNQLQPTRLFVELGLGHKEKKSLFPGGKMLQGRHRWVRTMSCFTRAISLSFS